MRLQKSLFSVNTNSTVDTKYTTKVGVPQYLPSATCPNIAELYNAEKYSKLLAEINNSNISEEDKKFLRFAATRHIIFRYDKIADYYAHADKELQELMEKSALVLIDIDDAIANGYVKLSKNIEKIMSETGKPVKDEEKS